ncbi:hypothetical protein ACFYKT_10715 [Cytobacillus sp. FJAT-53684]|uniref:Uncharacterized protein n=1 Tax=Cytobacillus mangrovibacter TaxID=3299024 RepID=A0ABW6JY28_9BACI
MRGEEEPSPFVLEDAPGCSGSRFYELANGKKQLILSLKKIYEPLSGEIRKSRSRKRFYEPTISEKWIKRSLKGIYEPEIGKICKLGYIKTICSLQSANK